MACSTSCWRATRTPQMRQFVSLHLLLSSSKFCKPNGIRNAQKPGSIPILLDKHIPSACFTTGLVHAHSAISVEFTSQLTSCLAGSELLTEPVELRET